MEKIRKILDLNQSGVIDDKLALELISKVVSGSLDLEGVDFVASRGRNVGLGINFKNKQKKTRKGFRRYTAADLRYIRNNYQNHSAREIADKLGRTYGSIGQKVKQLGIRKR